MNRLISAGERLVVCRVILACGDELWRTREVLWPLNRSQLCPFRSVRAVLKSDVVFSQANAQPTWCPEDNAAMISFIHSAFHHSRAEDPSKRRRRDLSHSAPAIAVPNEIERRPSAHLLRNGDQVLTSFALNVGAPMFRRLKRDAAVRCRVERAANRDASLPRHSEGFKVPNRQNIRCNRTALR